MKITCREEHQTDGTFAGRDEYDVNHVEGWMSFDVTSK